MSRPATILRALVSGAIVVAAGLNLWSFIYQASTLKPRREEPVVISESRIIGVRDALLKAHYLHGDVGYIPGRVLEGGARTIEEDTDWLHFRYGMIPWNLVQDTLNAPFVVLDFTRWTDPAELPSGFVAVYESGDGLILLRRANPQ